MTQTTETTEGNTTMNTDTTPDQAEKQRIDYDRLVAIAKARRPGVQDWCAIRGDSTRKHAQCFVCGASIASWEGDGWTKHAIEAIDKHRARHLAEMDEAEA